MQVVSFEPGGFRYIEGVFQYSAGVTAEPGHAIERVRLHRPLPLREGFAVAERRLTAIGRPMTAFCACELRSPAPFSEEGFAAFNREYVGTLERWGLYRDGVNPVARTNVCPERHKPAVPSMYAFSYTVPVELPFGGFIVAGSGETKEGLGNYRDHTIRPGDTSAEAMREKVRYVLGVMEERLRALGFNWADVSSTEAYTVFDIGGLLDGEFAERGVIPNGLEWHFCRPPVVGLDFEMDLRGPARELVLG